MKKLLLFFLLILLFSHLGFRIFENREYYLEKFDPKYWEQRYLNSQWVKAINPEPIGDDGVYTWAGWRYLHGENPILINPEMPPLGKYLLGLTIKITNNRSFFAVWTGLLSLAALFLIAKKALQNSLLSLIVVFLFSLEPLFYNQLRAPFLDNLYLSFFSFFLFFAYDNWLLSFLFLGAAASTKATLVTFCLGLATIFIFLLILKDKKEVKKAFLFSPISIFVLLLSYFRYFLSGHNLLDFLKVQKWIFVFYKEGVKVAKGMVFPLLFLNRWQRWWDETTSINEWRLTWPILTLGIFLFWLNFSKRKKKKINLHQLIMAIYSLLYLIFLSFVPVWPRYLLLFLPFSLILFVSWVKEALFGKMLK